MALNNRHIALTNLYRGEVEQFLQEAGFTSPGVTEVMTRLFTSVTDFRIEEIAYFPVVYLLDTLTPLEQILGPIQLIELGSSSSPDTVAADLLLRGAPLSTNHWKLYIHPKQERFAYGLFTAPALPVGHEPRHRLVSHDQNQIRVVKVARIANRCIELESNHAMTRRFFFGAHDNHLHSPYEMVNCIAEAIAAQSPEEIQPLLREYLFSTIKQSILGSHGALIAVSEGDAGNLPPCFTDGVILSPSLDIAAVLAASERTDRKLEYRTLATLGEALTGALRSDGVTLFNDHGHLIAYRAFCSLDQASGMVQGGARKRAYLSMRKVVEGGSGLRGVFIHSQDGWMDCAVRL